MEIVTLTVIERLWITVSVTMIIQADSRSRRHGLRAGDLARCGTVYRQEIWQGAPAEQHWPDGATTSLRIPLPEAVLLPTPNRVLPPLP
jgi:hypothetical protein